MSDGRFRLVTLGRLALLDDAGAEEPSLSRRRRKLALLAVLATSRRPIARATLVEMFWGDTDEERARHSLYDALSHLRRLLGKDAISARQDDVALARDLPLDVDLEEMEDATRGGDDVRAAALYGGPFLDGVSIPGSVSFERWCDGQRDRAFLLFVRASRKACDLLTASHKWDDCAMVARRWLDQDPVSADAALALIRALDCSGAAHARRAAVITYERFAESIAAVGGEPPNALRALVEEVRNRRDEPVAALAAAAPAPPVTPGSPATPPPPLVEPPVASRAGRAGRWRARAGYGLLGAAAIAGIALVPFMRSGGASDDPPRGQDRPVVAVVVSPGSVSPDSSDQWTADALTRMVSDALGRSAELEVIPPDPTQPHQRETGASDDVLSTARRAGATLAAVASVQRQPSGLVLELRVHDLEAGQVASTAVVSAPNPFALADEVAARVLTAAGARGPGLRFAELETSSVEAYANFMRGVTLNSRGNTVDGVAYLDRAIALDSNFVAALYARYRIALDAGPGELQSRLRARLDSVAHRATERDRLAIRFNDAWLGADHALAESIARTLVERYPHDPRGYELLSTVLLTHGRFDEAIAIVKEELAQAGPEHPGERCAGCVALGRLAQFEWVRGNQDGALDAARRHIELEPASLVAWGGLALRLEEAGRFDEAIAAARRSLALGADTAVTAEHTTRILIAARRFAEADSAIAALLASPATRARALDLRVRLERERGQYRRSIETTAQAARVDPWHVARMMGPDAAARLGDRKTTTDLVHRWVEAGIGAPPAGPGRTAGGWARAWAWHKAIAADARGRTGDTVALRAAIDSVERVGALSYYARDWRLHHHLRGLLHSRAGRWNESARELEQAMFGPNGWTRTNAELARVYLKLGRADDAIRVLRAAYRAPIEGMARYEPRTELDFLMATAFSASGRSDSASAYASHVRRAWANAEPEVWARIGELR